MAEGLDRARDAFDRSAWRRAYDQLTVAARDEPLEIEDLERLASAAYLIGRSDESSDVWSRAHQECARLGEVARAAQRLAQVAESVARRPENANHVEIRGAVPAPIERLRTRTRWQIWLRSSDRQALRRVARSLLAVDVGSKVRVALDVYPISTM